MFTISLIGNLGQDAKVFTGNSGREMMSFRVAASQPKNDTAIWMEVVMNHRPNLMPYLLKGTKVYVHGDATIELRNGYLNASVFASELELLGEKKAETPPAQGVQAVQGVPSQVTPPDPAPLQTPTYQAPTIPVPPAENKDPF